MDLDAAILAYLRRRPARACFVREVATALSGADFEQALTDLERRGKVLVRTQFCADPHLDNTDLRVVAAIDVDHSQSIAAIDQVWETWLADYLATHRCG